MARDPKILIINGPNLNMLGTREPDTYGTQTLADIETLCQNHGKEKGLGVTCFQSNSETALIETIQQARDQYQGIIINAGAYTHTSVAIHDALRAVDLPVIEVHLSNTQARETFRHHSYISPIARAIIAGCGTRGYQYALDEIQVILDQ